MTRPGAARRLVAAVLLAIAAAGCGGRGDLASADPERRAAAVRALSRRGARDDFTPLLVATRDGSPAVRAAAAEALAARGGPTAVSALGALLADPDHDVARAAARGLGAMSSSARARDALLEGYATASPAARAAIAAALDGLGSSLREAVEIEARLLWERNLTALGAAGPIERAGAAEELGVSGRADAVTRLVPLLDPARNPDRGLAAAAARGLGEAGDWAARPHLEALLAEGDAGLAEAGASGLGRLGDPAAADALARLGTSATGRVARAAVDALAALPEAPDVGMALCEVAFRSGDASVSARAARYARLRLADCPERPFLSRIGGAGAAPALEALGELGLTGAAAEAAAERIAPLLEGTRGDASTRAAAARALARLRVEATAKPVAARAEALVARLREARARWLPGALAPVPAAGFESGGDVRLAAALGRRGLRAASAEPPATPAWVDPFPADAAAELGALLGAAGRLRAPGAERLLLGLVRDPAAAIRAGAAEGLGGIGSDAAVGALAAALDDPAPAVRAAAADALAALKARGAPALAAAAARSRNEDTAWRAALARALGACAAPEAIPALIGLLDGPSAPAAAVALGRLGAAAARDPLAALLARPDASGRVEAIEALAQLVARDAGPIIAAQMTSDRPEVRAAAARSLGKLRYEGASNRLEALRGDYAGRVRRAAVEALAKLPTGARRPRP